MPNKSVAEVNSEATVEAELDAIQSKIAAAPEPTEIAPKEPRLGADSW